MAHMDYLREIFKFKPLLCTNSLFLFNPHMYTYMYTLIYCCRIYVGAILYVNVRKYIAFFLCVRIYIQQEPRYICMHVCVCIYIYVHMIVCI